MRVTLALSTEKYRLLVQAAQAVIPAPVQDFAWALRVSCQKKLMSLEMNGTGSFVSQSG